MTAEGYAEEMSSGDSINLGGLGMTGSITMGNNKITGLAAGTTDGDALAYGQTGAKLLGVELSGYNVTGATAGTTAGNFLVYGQTAGHLAGLNADACQITNVAAGATANDVLVYGQTAGHLAGLNADACQITNVAAGATANDVLVYGQTAAHLAGLNADACQITNVAAGTTAGDALAYGQTGAKLLGVELSGYNVTGATAGTTAGNFLVFGQTAAHLAGLNADSCTITNVARGTSNNEALVYGQSGAQLYGLDLQSQILTNVANPLVNSDGANKGYVDSVAQGLDVKGSVEVLSNVDISGPSGPTGLPGVVDGVTVEDGYRILLINQTNKLENGIWVVKDSNLWVRPDDFPAGLSAEGSYTLVLYGTTYATSGWVCNTHGGSIVGTNETHWVQFNGAGQITAGSGLWKDGNKLSVRLDLAPGATAAGATGAPSGLEFTSDSPAKLRVAVGATGGLQRSSNGLALLLDGSTLFTGATGAKVISAPEVLMTGTAGATAIAIGSPLYCTADGTVDNADALLPSDDKMAKVVGLAVAAANAGATVKFMSTGILTGLSSLTVGNAYYLSVGGGIGTIPIAGNRIIQVGIAIASDKLLVRILDYGKKAAV